MENDMDETEIYFDVKLRAFFRVEEVMQGGFLLAGPFDYYGDARGYGNGVVQRTIKLSDDYCERNLLEIGFIDQFEFAEQDALGNWRAKKD